MNYDDPTDYHMGTRILSPANTIEEEEEPATHIVSLCNVFMNTYHGKTATKLTPKTPTK